MNGSHDELPRSIAIAGAWGYIGRKFLDVALAHGLTTYVYDPGPPPADVDLGRLFRIADEAAFYELKADLFHLAVHPEHRRLDWLVGRHEPMLVLCEKPMALPDRPDDCGRIVEAVAHAQPTVLYDFPELYDPLTARVLDYLSRFRTVRITDLYLQRSKDREDPANPRNAKRMVSIQYQETVHCFAFLLHVLSALKGSLAAVLAEGCRITGQSELYAPPNPQDYREAVDGRCRFEVWLGDVRVEGLTDFKRGAPRAKRRIIRGLGDGVPFAIEVSYLEGEKSLRINGIDQPCDPRACSYKHVLTTSTRWFRQFERAELMEGLFPNPRFAQLTYQLSAALWKSCRDRSEITLERHGT